MNDPNHSSFMTNNRVRKIVNAKDPLNNDLDSENNVLSEEVEMRIFSNQNHRESKIYSKDQSSSNISTKLNNIKMFTKTKVNPNSLNFEEEDESDHPSKVISNSVYEYDRVINGYVNTITSYNFYVSICCIFQIEYKYYSKYKATVNFNDIC